MARALVFPLAVIATSSKSLFGAASVAPKSRFSVNAPKVISRTPSLIVTVPSKAPRFTVSTSVSEIDPSLSNAESNILAPEILKVYSASSPLASSVFKLAMSSSKPSSPARVRFALA